MEKRNPLFWVAILPIIYLILDIVFFSISLFPQQIMIEILFGIVLLPFYWVYIALSIVATIGIFKDRVWGFWIAVINVIYNLYISFMFIYYPYWFGIPGLQLFLYIIILILLIYWYFGDKKITEMNKTLRVNS